MAQTVTLDTVYTADEAASRLRLTNRSVIKLGKRHGLCSRRGRDYLFSEADILGMWEVLREPAKSRQPIPVKAHVSDFRLSESLRKLTAKKKGRMART